MEVTIRDRTPVTGGAEMSGRVGEGASGRLSPGAGLWARNFIGSGGGATSLEAERGRKRDGTVIADALAGLAFVSGRTLLVLAILIIVSITTASSHHKPSTSHPFTDVSTMCSSFSCLICQGSGFCPNGHNNRFPFAMEAKDCDESRCGVSLVGGADCSMLAKHRRARGGRIHVDSEGKRKWLKKRTVNAVLVETVTILLLLGPMVCVFLTPHNQIKVSLPL